MTPFLRECMKVAGNVGAAELMKQATGEEAGHARPVVLGQGLSTRQLADLRKDVNTLISAVRPCPAGSFEAALLVSQDNAALDDHITGQHLPAMLLLEACRQMWTAVTESFFRTAPGSCRFVVVRIESEFSQYAFPLPATLRYTLLDREASPVEQRFAARSDVIQLGTAVAEVRAAYRVVDEMVAAKHESMGARQAIASLLASAAAAVPARAGP